MLMWLLGALADSGALPRGGVQESLFLEKGGGKSQLPLCSLSVVQKNLGWLSWASNKHLHSAACSCPVFSGVTCSKGGHGYGHKIGFSSHQGILDIKSWLLCLNLLEYEEIITCLR